MPPSTDAAQALTSSKSTFLTSQFRLLDTPLTTPTSNIPLLPKTIIDKTVAQVNKKISQQNKLVYSLESRRHVLEQIDGVYWRDVLAAGLPVRKAETVVKREVDFTSRNSQHGVEVLPDSWEDVVLGERPAKRRRRRRMEDQDGQGEEGQEKSVLPTHNPSINSEDIKHDQQTAKYAELRERLLARSQRRKDLQRKMARYKHLQTLLRPLENPHVNIQPNLVTRDNKELESELVRMRVLLARAGNALQQKSTVREAGTDSPGPHSGGATNLQKLQAVLELG
ncbi:hypothetical protein LTR05_004174 [Lithohypha guttulata]|uniref:Kinetochore protein fta4 n=1 Tax=Lithohypha guttulata TaxID=1690604 RepID=A0AAN7T1W2_9EURO|nr:hypothetical protein LTR05_004174 [Lithohypha guttulata]